MATTNLILTDEEYDSIPFSLHFSIRDGLRSLSRDLETRMGYEYKILEDWRVYAEIIPNEGGNLYYIPRSIDITKIPLGFTNGVKYIHVELKPLKEGYQPLGVVVETTSSEQSVIDKGVLEGKTISIDRAYYLSEEEYQTALDNMAKVRDLYGLKYTSAIDALINRCK